MTPKTRGQYWVKTQGAKTKTLTWFIKIKPILRIESTYLGLSNQMTPTLARSCLTHFLASSEHQNYSWNLNCCATYLGLSNQMAPTLARFCLHVF